MLHSNTDIIKHPVTTVAFFYFLSDIYGVGMEIYWGGGPQRIGTVGYG